jgi:hypothetical protein
MEISTNAEIEIEFEIDESDLDIETHVTYTLGEQLDGYISGIKDDDLCSLGEKLQQAIRLTVRDMFTDLNV